MRPPCWYVPGGSQGEQQEKGQPNQKSNPAYVLHAAGRHEPDQQPSCCLSDKRAWSDSAISGIPGNRSTRLALASMKEFNAWTNSLSTARASIARGQTIFNSKAITIYGVAGINDVTGLPASFSGTCGTCHDSPDVGNHSVSAPLNIGVSHLTYRRSQP
jgi:hypothetical protein